MWLQRSAQWNKIELVYRRRARGKYRSPAMKEWGESLALGKGTKKIYWPVGHMSRFNMGMRAEFSPNHETEGSLPIIKH